MVAKHENMTGPSTLARDPHEGTFDSIYVPTDKRTFRKHSDPFIRGLSPRQSRPLELPEQQFPQPTFIIGEFPISQLGRRRRNKKERQERDRRAVKNSNARQAGMWAGLGGFGAAPVRHAFTSHGADNSVAWSREPGVARGRGWSQATLVPRRVSKLFWRGRGVFRLSWMGDTGELSHYCCDAG